MPLRDNFSPAVARLLANRAGHRCSNPECRRDTSGPSSESHRAVNLGVAAHITAAAPGGARYHARFTPAERSAPANGIWLCQGCAKLVDNDAERFPVALLKEWKTAAETLARSLLTTPAAPRLSNEPALTIPSSDPALSLLPFSARATTFVGRTEQQEALAGFLDSSSPFAWWLVTGPAGSGKSRLALELCEGRAPRWRAGFLSRTRSFSTWTSYRPIQPTLIVVDYVASRAKELSDAALQLCRDSKHFPCPVRMLLVERDQGSWWSTFAREDSLSEAAELEARLYEAPLVLGPMGPDELVEISRETATLVGDKCGASMSASAILARLKATDPLGRPLFGMMSAVSSNEAPTDPRLLRGVLLREAARRKQLVPEPERLRKLENLILLATMTGGLLMPNVNSRDLAPIATLIPEVDVVDAHRYRDLVGIETTGAVLPGLQPDILGERLVLDRLSGQGAVGIAAKQIRDLAWRLQPSDFSEFVVRAGADFPTDPGLDPLCALPLDSSQQRATWGGMAAELIRVLARSDDSRTDRLLRSLRELAVGHAGEPELRNAIARAAFYRGNHFLFVKGQHEMARAQYDEAIALAGATSALGVSAINNRGILSLELANETEAFEDWTRVIETSKVPDEARACAYNNRADVFVRRGQHDRAIEDRTSVLSLSDTTYNRRYIALARRSRSFAALGRRDDALADLGQILATDDIAPTQKAEAAIARGCILIDAQRIPEARRDFEAVLESDDVFSGAYHAALVWLADAMALEGDSVRALEYLDTADKGAAEARDESIVQATLVRARVLEAAGDVAGAEALWEGVLADPRASTAQRALAGSKIPSGRT